MYYSVLDIEDDVGIYIIYYFEYVRGVIMCVGWCVKFIVMFHKHNQKYHEYKK